MNAFQRFVARSLLGLDPASLDEKASRHYGAILSMAGKNTVRWTPRAYEPLAREGYQQNGVAFTCINLAAGDAAELPIQLVRDVPIGGGKVQIEPVEVHPALDLLYNPNPMQSEQEFRQAWGSFLLISGNSYLHGPGPDALSPNAGRPVELWTLRPDRMNILVGDMMQPVAGYEYQEGTRPKFSADEVSHTKLFNPLDDFYGMSPLEAAAREVDQHNASGEWNASMLQNAGAPSFWANLKGNLPNDQVDSLRARFAQRVQGPRNARKPIITKSSDGVEFHRLGFDAVEMDWLEGRKMSAGEICMVFRIPPQMLGIPGSLTYANYEQARKAMYTEAVVPLGKVWAQTLTRWLLPKYERSGSGLYFRVNIDEVEALQEDQNERMNRAVKAFEANLATQRQAALMAGLDDEGTQDLYHYQIVPKAGPREQDRAAMEQAKARFAKRYGAVLERRNGHELPTN